MRPVTAGGAPGVTVVVPCYDYGRHLAQLAGWALEQPGLDTRLLIVDDASPDGSGELAEALAVEDDRVTVVRHRTNAGHIQTYNDGLSRVDTEYVMLLSADDLVPPGALSRAVALMEQHQRVGMVYGYARSFTGEPPVPRSRVRSWTVWSGTRWLHHTLGQGRSFVVSPEVVMRTEALRSVGLYDPRLPHSADLDLWLRTALRWDVGRVNGPDQALYRVHASNMHLTDYAGWVTDLRERAATFDIFFDEHAAGRPDLQPLRVVVRRRLAREALGRALAGHRDGLDAREVEQLATLAHELDPRVARTPAGRLWATGPGRGRALPAARPLRFAGRVNHHLRWRRERRYGY